MSVFKKHRGKRITPKDKNWSKGTWYMYKRVYGRPIHKSLQGASTKEEAEKAERKIITDAFNKKYGIASQETFESFVERVYKKYVKQNNVNLAAKDLYIRLLCGALGREELAAITPQDCRNVQMGFRKKYSASSVNLIMSTASKIFNLAGEEGILDKNPMQFVKRMKEPPARDRILSKDERERLWQELMKDSLLFPFVTLAVNLPLRKGQLLAITPDAIDFQTGSLSVIGSKGRPPRLVPINSAAANTLSTMTADGLLPFPLKETGIRKRFVKALKKANIENFKFHDLRHCMATELDRNGVTRERINKLYAHSSMKMTSVYINPEFEDMADAVRTLDIQQSEVVQ